MNHPEHADAVPRRRTGQLGNGPGAPNHISYSVPSVVNRAVFRRSFARSF